LVSPEQISGAPSRRLIPAYAQVITTRTYDDRLETISHVRNAGISVCSGGIVGLGESDSDRVGLIWEASQCVPCIHEGSRSLTRPKHA
jgi:hypothetical protein